MQARRHRAVLDGLWNWHTLDGDAFGHHDDGEGAFGGMTLVQLGHDVVDMHAGLGRQHQVGATAQRAGQGHPAGVSAHHLDHHHAVVGAGGRL